MGRLGSAIGIALSNTLFEYKISTSYDSFTNYLHKQLVNLKL